MQYKCLAAMYFSVYTIYYNVGALKWRSEHEEEKTEGRKKGRRKKDASLIS